MNPRLAAAAVALVWTILALSAPAAEPAHKTPLDEYIAKPDPTYSWKLVETVRGDDHTTFIVDLKSQTWRAAPDVDQAAWQHWLVVVKPDEVRHDTAYLRIGGGNNGRAAPKQAAPQLAELARTTHTVVAELGQVPNQPLVFNNDGEQRVEDNLIAYGHVKFM